MSAPAAITWAASGAITTPSADKLAIGFVPGERPPAQTLNYVLNLLALWIAYLASHANTGWRYVSPRGDTPTNGSGGFFARDVSTGNYIVNSTVTGGDIVGIPVVTVAGQTITQLGVRSYAFGGTGQAMSVTLFKSIGTDAAATSVGAVIVSGGSAGWREDTVTLGTPEVIVEGVSYWFTISVGAGISPGATKVSGVGFNIGG